VPMAMPSPSRVSVQSLPLRSSPTGIRMMWPGSPTLAMSPTAAQSPKTPAPIDKFTFLQARNVAVQLAQGPPGLAQWAPTPTTKANLLGFRYPQPGYISVVPKNG
ncbi:unnamed protein product, partial [Polarella glacialis]